MYKTKKHSTIKRLRMCKYEIGNKFASIEEAETIVKNLVEFIGYHCKEKGYFCQAIIGVSQLDSSNTVGVKKEITNKRGRPRVLPVFTSSRLPEGINGYLERIEPVEIKKKPHIHMMILCCPGESFGKRIRKYLLSVLAPTDINGDETIVMKKPCNIDHAE